MFVATVTEGTDISISPPPQQSRQRSTATKNGAEEDDDDVAEALMILSDSRQQFDHALERVKTASAVSRYFKGTVLLTFWHNREPFFYSIARAGYIANMCSKCLVAGNGYKVADGNTI